MRISRTLKLSIKLLLIVGLGQATLAAAAAAVGATAELPEALNLHQWGGVTLFHGLPSAKVRAIAQDDQGVLWFGTDGGLAKYDGRRTERITDANLPIGSVLALHYADGTLWIGTTHGATRMIDNRFRLVEEANNLSITSITVATNTTTTTSNITEAHNTTTTTDQRVVLTSAQGVILDCREQPNGSLDVRRIADHPLLSVERAVDGVLSRRPLELTGAAIVKDALLIATRGRGLLRVTADDVVEEVTLLRPRQFFIETIKTDQRAGVNQALWFGAQTSHQDSGLYSSVHGESHPLKRGARFGTITTIGFDRAGEVWVGTAGQGLFHYRRHGDASEGESFEHFTFEGTAGGLLSNNILSVFVDREDVVWIGTDRGVCRYDPHAARYEQLSGDPESNFVRSLLETSSGYVFCGTNRGLFVRAAQAESESAWQPVADFQHKTVHALAEASDGRLLVGTANNIYINRAPLLKSTGVRLPPNPVGEFQSLDVQEADLNSVASRSVRAIAVFHGKIYVAMFEHGLMRLDGDRLTLLRFNDEAMLNLRGVVSLHTATDNRSLWIGTIGGAVYELNDEERLMIHPALTGLRGQAVWSVAGGSRAAGLWIATAKGLYLYRANKLTSVVLDVDARHVALDGAAAATSAQAFVWCATDGGGLLKILYDEPHGAITSRLDVEHGLPSPHVFAVLPLRGAAQANKELTATRLLIGTARGLSAYKPGTVAPSLVVTSILSHRLHRPEELPQSLHLDYPQNSLLLDVAAISSRTYPESFQYHFIVRDKAGRIVKESLSRNAQLIVDGLALDAIWSKPTL